MVLNFPMFFPRMSAVDLLREDKDNEVIIAVAAFVLIGFYIFL